MEASVVFIILNYNTFGDTIILVKEILDSEIPDSVIIVVDNCSPNGSYQQLMDAFGDEPKVDVISSLENGGYAKGNNIGLRHAKKYQPKYACIINNDVHFSAETIAQLIQDVKSYDEVGAIAPKQVLPNGEEMRLANSKLESFKDDLRSFVLTLPPRNNDDKATVIDGRIKKVGFVSGAFIFMRYEIAERIGFFDESTFLYGEERFLAKRLEEEGLGCYIDIKTYYIHAHSKTISGELTYKRRRELMLKSRQIYIEKYYRFGRMKSFILGLLGYAVINLKSLYKH